MLETCAVCRLGFSEGGVPYVIPINYGYTYADGVITVFFHCAGEGRKIDIMKQNPVVCFEIDRVERLDPAGSPENISLKWESLIGTGRAQFVEDSDEKKKLLGNMMRIYGGYNPNYRPEVLSDERVHGVTMFKIVLDEFKAKRILHD
jgi:nitroimidazol reductase NimA-like FMN-containing flavoprotein (pyridoxamine 5'-phosphate oxidase superfamily)